MIETHAHLYDDQFNDDIEAVIERFLAEEVTQVWLPNCDSTTSNALISLANEYPDLCVPMMGLHPCYVKEDAKNELDRIREILFKSPENYPLIGEIGLDFYWDLTFVEQQKWAFRQQLGWASALQKPISIHCRNSFWETHEIIKQHDDPTIKGIFHCFSGGIEEAKAAIEIGFLLGIGGVVTFKNGGLSPVIEAFGLEYFVLETDAPYLAPVPFRGKRNEPAYLTFIAQKIAEIKGVSKESVVEETTKNAKKLLLR